ncbi:LysR family transcriptional regulator [Pigmentiphaga soli]
MNALLTFDALMRTRSATAAAALLHKTQPAISRELARLRRTLGDPLLVVTRGRFVPTERALELHAVVHDALARVEEALQSHDDFDPATAQAVVNIGTGAHLEVVIGARLLERLRVQAPGVTVRFQSVHGDFEPEDLDTERIDIALGLFGKVPPRFHSASLFRDRRVCVIAATHPMAGHGPLTLDDLAGFRWFAFAQMYDRETNFDRVLKPHHRAIVFSAYLSGFGITPYVLLDTDYATTMPACVAQAHKRHFPLATLELPPPLRDIEYFMVWSKRQHTSPLHRWVRAEIVDAVRHAREASAPTVTPGRRRRVDN